MNKFDLQNTAQNIVKSIRSDPLDLYPIEHCHRSPVKWAGKIAMVKHPNNKQAHFVGLQTCKKWHCPVCAAHLMAIRSNEIQTMITRHMKADSGNTIIMLTITTPHCRRDSLVDLLKLQDSSIAWMKNQKSKKINTYKDLMTEIESVGELFVREVVWSNRSGWNPHRHVLLFCKYQTDSDLEKLQKELTELFIKAYRKQGGKIPKISDFRQHSIKLTQYSGDNAHTRYIARYLSKSAFTYFPSNNGSMTPFALLESSRHDNEKSMQYAALYLEFFNLQRLSMVRASPGLKKKFGIVDKTDTEAIEQSISDKMVYIDDITPYMSTILKHRLFGKIRQYSATMKPAEMLAMIKKYEYAA